MASLTGLPQVWLCSPRLEPLVAGAEKTVVIDEEGPEDRIVVLRHPPLAGFRIEAASARRDELAEVVEQRAVIAEVDDPAAVIRRVAQIVDPAAELVESGRLGRPCLRLGLLQLDIAAGIVPDGRIIAAPERADRLTDDRAECLGVGRIPGLDRLAGGSG